MPANASNKNVTWSSSSPAATVSGGVVTGQSAGSATITCTTVDGDKKATCTVKVLDEAFNYSSSTYNASLAERCALYAMLAYDEMELKGQDLYVDKGKGHRKDEPEALKNKLATDNFDDLAIRNYQDDIDYNVSYVLARKQVSVYGSERTLVAVIIRGTDDVEWKGNMDITGFSFDPSVNDHYSFHRAEINLRTNNGLYNYISSHSIVNPIYLITGHSRGAAVANLLADTLSITAGPDNVFAYTFATPNNTKNPNASRTNIFNFCFDDDFVPQVPLTDWGYGKHGITYTTFANDLYNNNLTFYRLINKFLRDSKRKEASFSHFRTQLLIDHVSEHWGSVQEYYETFIHTQPYVTLYSYFRDVVAPAAMGNELAGLILVRDANLAPPDLLTPIAKFFVDGSPLGDDLIYDTHHAFTYYIAVKYGYAFLK